MVTGLPRYKIDPNGKYVLVTLWAADKDQCWNGLKRLQLFRPYEMKEPEQVSDPKNNFI